MRKSSFRIEPQRVRRLCAGGAAVGIHCAVLFAVVFSDGPQGAADAAPAPTLQLVPVDREQAATASAERANPKLPTLDVEMQLSAATPVAVPPVALSAMAVLSEDAQPTPISTAISEPETSVDARNLENVQAELLTFEIPKTERAALAERLSRSAQESGDVAQTQVAWQDAGRHYTATLTREPAADSMSHERIVADVTMTEDGRALTTRLSLQRLAFSQFTQVIDRWDPEVQLHADEIVGRFHSNSAFNLLYDSRTAPKFIGKVTTAARGYNAERNGRKRDAEIFSEGVETRTGRLELPRDLLPLDAREREAVRIHEFEDDTRIHFFKDGSYTWRTRDASATGYVNDPSRHPVFFVGARGVTLSVKGTVSGKMLVYAQDRIVIEGNVRYAHDPREFPDSNDYLGLVCDRDIEIAGPLVTGPGDLTVDAAVFARRRFLVRDFEHKREALLTIYGSLTAGTISASEPRYASKVDYDARFERVRPPHFPITDRYAVQSWNGQWTEQAGKRLTASE